MHIAGWRGLLGQALVILAISACSLAGCSPIRGYPNDPENTDATLDRLKLYFDGTREAEYFKPTNTAEQRAAIRNEIVLARTRAYDIEFAEFERRLYGDANAVSLGSDLTGLILGGLTATTGNAGTKAALGAASTGVLGANTAISRDLYYQRTVPALLAQMEADRLVAKAPILAGLQQPDAKYPLMQAYIDLDIYKNAGSIPGAINAINRDAGNAKDDAITFTRDASYIAQLPNVVTVQTQLKPLTDLQFVMLARAMEPYLTSRPPELQRLVKTIDPNGARLNGNARKARQAINAWVGEEDMSAANQKQWLDTISSVSK